MGHSCCTTHAIPSDSSDAAETEFGWPMSSDGFSSYFPMPSYQADSGKAYQVSMASIYPQQTGLMHLAEPFLILLRLQSIAPQKLVDMFLALLALPLSSQGFCPW